MTEQQQLLAAIAANPADDTVRLAYADYLDEQGRVSVPWCPDCNKKVKRWGQCPRCGATCRHDLDTSNADRAEFIRVQIALSPPYTTRSLIDMMDRWPMGAVAREKQLRDAHPEWSWCPCPACRGTGGEFTPEVQASGGWKVAGECKTCGGTGDMFLRPDNVSSAWPQPTKSRNPVFRRGFVESVECRLEEIGGERPAMCPDYAAINRRRGAGGATEMRCGKCDGGTITRFTPSPWARAVVAAVPTLTRLVIQGKEPIHVAAGWMWCRNTSPTDSDPWGLDGWLYDALGDFERSDQQLGIHRASKFYPTRADALDALYVGVCKLVRGSL